jgi:2-keto-3-deoxy-L-rhamnonate aldolase RhmA
MGMKCLTDRLDAKVAPLFGLTLSTFDPVFVDVAAQVGIDVVWIEMEHAGMTMREAETLCRLINGGQMLSLIRLPNGERDTVLRAAESGSDMLMMPMVNRVEDLDQFVKHARYTPQGERGYYRSSRALNYGLGGTIAELRRQANESLMLWGQIETLTALENLEDLCQVVGIDGLFMGPGDLSSSYGVPGDTSDPRVVEAIATGIRASHTHGKCSGTVAAPEDVSQWVNHSIDLLFVGSNVGFYVSAAESLRQELEVARTRIQGSPTPPYRGFEKAVRIDERHAVSIPIVQKATAPATLAKSTEENYEDR